MDMGVMAPNYMQDRLAISFSWFGDATNLPRYTQTMDLFIELGVLEFKAKVHLGKYHTVSPRLRTQYPIQDMQNKIDQYDPRILFQNDYTKGWFMSSLLKASAN
jgi:hypothetical protein